jgi:hypothetical protein
VCTTLHGVMFQKITLFIFNLRFERYGRINTVGY